MIAECKLPIFSIVNESIVNRQFFHPWSALKRAFIFLLLLPLPSGQESARPIQAQPAARQLTIPAIFAEGGITGRSPETVEWSPDGSKVSYVLRDDSGERGELWYLDAITGKPAVLVGAEKLAGLAPPESRIQNEREKERRTRYSVAGYHWAPDSRHLLFDSNGQLWLYSLETGTAVQLTSAVEPSGDPKFSPDGARVAYVRKHNLYVGAVSGDSELQLTRDGDENILNGEVDWVYAEELEVRSNYFWSPSGHRIAFLQMNEKQVPSYPITDLLPTHPTVDMQKYPKAGDPNPEVRVGVVSPNGGRIKWINIDQEDIYIPRFGWIREGLLYVEVLNRDQDKLDLFFIDPESGRSRLVLSESAPGAWVRVHDDFRLLKSGDGFLWPSWRDGHTHLYLYSFDKSNPLAADARPEGQLTRGDFEVFSVAGVDEAAGLVYFTANQGDARQRHLFSVRLRSIPRSGTTAASPGSGSPGMKDLRRISREEGWHEPSFAESAGAYVDNFSSTLTPPRLAFCNLPANCSVFWQARAVEPYSLMAPQFVDFRAEDGTVLHGSLLMPPREVSIAGTKIPLLMNPYGGPEGHSVRHAWGGTTFLFHQLLARAGIAILQVDNRGTGARGRKFAAVLRHNFGETELKDQLAALEQALAAYPVLDRNRLGWWGWSYGGYLTVYAMTHSRLFKAGVAVAPVTDWLDYDSIYTERYMGLPKANADGYRRSSPVYDAARLSGKLLVVHGTSDDNVHLQNTVQLTQNLITAGRQFDLLLYPGKTHGISGPAARTHLFTRIQQHFESELLGSAPPAAVPAGNQ